MSQNTPRLDFQGRFDPTRAPSDLTVTVGSEGRQFDLHRDVMIQSSRFFKRYFDSNENSGDYEDGIVTISEMDSKVFENCVQFIYMGDYATATTLADHADTFGGAALLGIPALKDECMRLICQELTHNRFDQPAVENILRQIYANSTANDRHAQVQGQQSYFFKLIDYLMNRNYIGFADGTPLSPLLQELPELYMDLLMLRKIEGYMITVAPPQYMCQQCRILTDSKIVFMPCGARGNGNEVIYVQCEQCNVQRGGTWVCKECRRQKRFA